MNRTGNCPRKVSISSTFNKQLLRVQILKAQKDRQVVSIFCAFGICAQKKLLVEHWLNWPRNNSLLPEGFKSEFKSKKNDHLTLWCRPTPIPWVSRIIWMASHSRSGEGFFWQQLIIFTPMTSQLQNTFFCIECILQNSMSVQQT